MEGNERFNWAELVPLVVHPLKVTIIEAMAWIDMPLSANDLTRVIDNKAYGLSTVSYHVNTLGKMQIFKVVRRRKVRGATETFYFFE